MRKAKGFSLIELMVVVGLIGVLVAVALPNVMGFYRSGRIRQAQTDILSALQRARNRAISTNSTQGVIFAIENPTTYWVHIEDDATNRFSRRVLDMATPDPIYSTRYQLPTSVEFAAVSADCPQVSGFAGNRAALRFDKYGARRVPGLPSTEPTPNVTGGTTVTRIHLPSASGEASVCVIDRQTNLRRAIQVGAGGRIRPQQQ